MTKAFHLILIRIILSSIVLFILAIPALAQVSLDDLNRQVLSLQAQKDNYDYLKQEMAEYRNFLEKQQEEHRNFLQTYYTIIISGLGLLGIFFALMVGKTKKDIEKQLKVLYERYALEVWGEESTKLKDRIKRQEKLLASEINYRNANVLVVVSKNSRKFVEKDVEEPLNERGITNITVVTEFDDGIAEEVKRGQFDAIVRYYERIADNDSIDEVLDQMVNLMVNSRLHVPLIVYTYKTESMSNKDRVRIIDYRYAVAANFPITLVDYVITAVSLVKTTNG